MAQTIQQMRREAFRKSNVRIAHGSAPTEQEMRALLDQAKADLAARQIDPLIAAILAGDRVTAHELLDQTIDALHHGRELADVERGYLLVPFGQLTIQQVRALVPDAIPSLSPSAAD